MGKLKLLSFNANGLGDGKKRRDLFTWLRQKNCDICFVQETHCTDKMEEYWKAEWGYEVYFSNHTGNSRGVAILFNNTFEFKIVKRISDPNGRYLILNIIINNNELNLVNVYGPNKDEPAFFENLQTTLENLPQSTFIIGGDFNVVQNFTLDTRNIASLNNPKSQVAVESMKLDLDLHDPWREKNPNTQKFTWHARNKLSRLDYWLISSDVLETVENVQILPGYRSDHSLVALNLSLNSHDKGPGLWKFNNSLLRDKAYVQQVKACIQNTVKQYGEVSFENYDDLNLNNYPFTISDQLFLETLKLEIRGFTIAYTAAKKKARKQQEQELERKIDDCFQRLSTNPTEEDTLLFNDLNEQLKIHREPEIEGILARAKARWHLHGERNSRYFCNLERRHYNQKCIEYLINDEGHKLSNLNDIIEEQRSFYADLYKTRNPSITDKQSKLFFPDDFENRLTSEEAADCEEDITYEECLSVLKKMKNGKSPGSSGFTAEFYKFFWADLHPFLLRSFNDSFEKESLSITQRLGVITCIPKPGKSRDYIKNWRPITLLNIDYKILSGVIAERMKKHLNLHISDCQKAFLKGRYIGECTRLLYDMIHELDAKQASGLLLLLDFEKCFDSLEWSFLDKTLAFFGYGQKFRKWISIFYTDAHSCIINNGFLSDRFQVNRGVRQGDPLSPYLFILVAEILTNCILKHPDINGISIDDTEYLLSQYADDAKILLEDNETSFKTCFEVLDEFANCSGLRINYSKTIIVRLGNSEDTRFLEERGLKWQFRGKFTVLGISFDLNKKDMVLENYTKYITQFEAILNSWSARQLTFYGRLVVLKSLAISKLVHLFTALPNPPEEIIQKLQKKCFKFLWAGKPDRIKRTTMYNTVDKGGLKIPNIDIFSKALKISWIKRLFSGEAGTWTSLFATATEDFGGNYIWLCTDKSPQFLKKLNPFWQDVYKSWLELANSDVKDDPRRQPIFHNPNILISGKPFFYPKWFNAGILYINDLISESRQFFPLTEFCDFHRLGDDEKPSFLQYKAVIDAIPKQWKVTIENKNLNPQEAEWGPLNVLRNLAKPSRYFYNLGIDRITTTPDKAIGKWENSFKTEPDEIDWSFAFTAPYKATDETKLRYFQFKLIHRFLPTNTLLYKYKIVNSKSCTFCDIYEETLEHLFFHCLK